MAIKIVSSYSKRLGLPGYSSHHFSVSVETELTDVGQIQHEASRIYGILQEAVDREIQQVGFVPPDTYGMDAPPVQENRRGPNGSGAWACSEKQKELILSLVDEGNLSREAIDQLAQERFGLGLPHLNKLQASSLISELLPQGGNGSNGKGRPFARKGGRS